MVFKIHYEKLGQHVHQRVFVGPDGGHLALSGKLVMREEEAEVFHHALLVSQSINKDLEVLLMEDVY